MCLWCGIITFTYWGILNPRLNVSAEAVLKFLNMCHLQRSARTALVQIHLSDHGNTPHILE